MPRRTVLPSSSRRDMQDGISYCGLAANPLLKYPKMDAGGMTAVKIFCPVNPSEDAEKVHSAVMTIFPDAIFELVDGAYRGSAPGLDRFSALIRKERILDATRSILLRNAKNDRTRFMINKQVATVGKISFVERPPVLGAIEVSVEDDDILALIDRVSPVTVNGEEVKP